VTVIFPPRSGFVQVEKTGVQGAINDRVATTATAANEVLARVADVASSDLLDFIEATGKGCSLSTTSGREKGTSLISTV